MSDYQQTRDTHALPIYEFTTQLATLEPPPPEMQQLLGAVHGNQDAMDTFVSITAGTVSPVEFFDPDEHRPHHERRASGVAHRMSPPMTLTTTASRTAPKRYESNACRSAVRRILRVWMTASDV